MLLEPFDFPEKPHPTVEFPNSPPPHFAAEKVDAIVEFPF
jgi:hypothetical protein